MTRFLHGDADLEPSESVSGYESRQQQNQTKSLLICKTNKPNQNKNLLNVFVCSSISYVLVLFQKVHVTSFPLCYLSTLQTLPARHTLHFQADIQGMRSSFLCLVRKSKSNSVIPSWLRTIWGPSGCLDTVHSTEQNPAPANLGLFFQKHSVVGYIRSEERGEIANLMDLISQAGFLPVSGLCRA